MSCTDCNVVIDPPEDEMFARSPWELSWGRVTQSSKSTHDPTMYGLGVGHFDRP